MGGVLRQRTVHYKAYGWMGLGLRDVLTLTPTVSFPLLPFLYLDSKCPIEEMTMEDMECY